MQQFADSNTSARNITCTVCIIHKNLVCIIKLLDRSHSNENEFVKNQTAKHLRLKPKPRLALHNYAKSKLETRNDVRV